MLQSMRNVVAVDEDYSYITFLSGQDYLLQAPAAYVKYFKENKEIEFMSIQKLESAASNMVRIRKYHLNGYSFKGKKIVVSVINKILPLRKFRYPFEIRKGSQSFTITGETAIFDLEFAAKNRAYCHYFKLVDTPDEFFFQTILYNSHFKPKIRDGAFHYID